MRSISVYIALPFTALPAGAFAVELLLKPHVDAGIMEYEFDQAANYAQTADRVQGEFDVSDLLPFAGAGITAIYGRFFVDFYGQVTAEGSDSGSQDVLDPTSADGGRARFNSDIENKAASVTAGYRVLENLSLLAGYRYSETEIDLNDVTLEPIPGLTPFDPFSTSVHLDFTYHGPMIGLSYAIPIEQLDGALQITTAATYLFGEVEQDVRGEAPDSSQYSGDALGYNFGIGWTGRISDRFSYSLLADASKYDFDGSGDTAPDFSESIYRLRAQIAYNFDIGKLFYTKSRDSNAIP